MAPILIAFLLFFALDLNPVHMQAAAAMAVGVGSFSDPDDVPVRQGIALVSLVPWHQPFIIVVSCSSRQHCFEL